jgi:hypothetical protein
MSYDNAVIYAINLAVETYIYTEKELFIENYDTNNRFKSFKSFKSFITTNEPELFHMIILKSHKLYKTYFQSHIDDELYDIYNKLCLKWNT